MNSCSRCDSLHGSGYCPASGKARHLCKGRSRFDRMSCTMSRAVRAQQSTATSQTEPELSQHAEIRNISKGENTSPSTTRLISFPDPIGIASIH